MVAIDRSPGHARLVALVNRSRGWYEACASRPFPRALVMLYDVLRDKIRSMAGCGCEHEAQDRAQRRALAIALGLNAMMFLVGIVAGWLAHSSALTADALDMLADVTGYAVGLLAIGRGVRFKSWSTTLNGSLLLVLGSGVVIDAIRRVFEGHHPVGWVMILIAAVALLVNGSVLLVVLKPFRHGEMFLRSFWLDTRADVVANVGVILSGLLVLLTHSAIPDVVVGIAIGLYVIKEAIEILRERSSAAVTDT